MNGLVNWINSSQMTKYKWPINTWNNILQLSPSEKWELKIFCDSMSPQSEWLWTGQGYKSQCCWGCSKRTIFIYGGNTNANTYCYYGKQSETLWKAGKKTPESRMTQLYDYGSHYRGICKIMFMDALWTIARTLNPSRYPSTDEWIKKMWYTRVCTRTHTHSGILCRCKEKVKSWYLREVEELGLIMLSEINRTQKDKYHAFSHIWFRT